MDGLIKNTLIGLKMTEDDTFRKLKRIPYRDMAKLMIDFHWNSGLFPNQASLKKLMESNGWTEKEYEDEYNRLNGG